MRIWIFAVVLLTAALSSCNSQKLVNAFAPAAEIKAAETILDEIGRGEFAPVVAAIDPAVQARLTPEVLRQLQAVLAKKPLKSRKAIGSQIEETKDFTQYAISHEYEFGSEWAVTQIVFRTQNGRRTIVGIHARVLPQSLEQINAFTLSRGPRFLLVLALAVFVPIFIVWTAVICWRTPIPKRKWLWRIFALLGIGACTLNWTTGELRFLPIQFQLLGAGFTQPPFGPLILQVGFPLGAILFWMRRKAWLRQPNEAGAESG